MASAAQLLAIGALEDYYEIGADDDEVGADDDEVGADDDEVGADDDEVGADDDEVGAVRRILRKVKIAKRKKGGRVMTLQEARLRAELQNERRRAAKNLARQDDTATTLGVPLTAVTAGANSNPIIINPSTPFLPSAFSIPPDIAQYFDIVSLFVGRMNMFGSSDQIAAVSFAFDMPTPIAWPGFDSTQPLIMIVKNNDTVNARNFRGTLFGKSRSTKSL